LFISLSGISKTSTRHFRTQNIALIQNALKPSNCY